jgi:TolB-like protein/Tfp pilus assembly protein PilF
MPTEPKAEGVWVKLRRRKVVQWGVTYAAAAWALLQGIDFLVDAFQWPDATRPLATLVLLLGLPVTLAIAWYHGDRGEQRVSAAEFTIIGLLLLLGGGFIWFYDHNGVSPPPVAGTEQLAAIPENTTPADGRPSIAVLPFENRSRLEDDAFFVDGIHDDILTQLSKISALRVISRTSVEQFRDTRLPIRNIAGQLGVTSVLEGGVQRAGDRVRINVQLIDAASDAHLWAESYDRELTAVNIFTIQSEVAAAIAGSLQASLTPAEQARANTISTQDLQAWEAYQLGKQRMLRRTRETMSEALALFEKSIAADPGFAPAYVGLADTLLIQIFYGFAPREESLARATMAIEKALVIDPNLAAAHASLGKALEYRNDRVAAEAEYRTALSLNPNYATAYHWYALLLVDLGRFDEARQAAQRALALDPLSALFHNLLGLILERLGHFEGALASYHKAIEIDPAMPVLIWNMGMMQVWAFGRIDEAVPWLERGWRLAPQETNFPEALSELYLCLGDDKRAAQWLERAEPNGADDVYHFNSRAEWHLYRGEHAEARALAQKAFALDAPSADLFILRDADLSSGNRQAARGRYAQAFPELLATEAPPIDIWNYRAAIELALVLQQSGEGERAARLLDLSEQFIQRIQRMGQGGFGIADVQIAALRGQKDLALAQLREAEQAGWRDYWWYFRSYEPAFAPIRDDPEFKAVFADIERDMAAQRDRLETREKQTDSE